MAPMIRKRDPGGRSNVFGGTVNIAARTSTSAGVMFEDRGEHALKGIAEPVRVFAVRAPGAG